MPSTDERATPRWVYVEVVDADLELAHVALGPDGGSLATAGDEVVLRRYPDRSLQWRRPLRVRAGAVVFSPDSRRLAVASIDGRIVLWDAATGQEQLTVEHDGPVSALAFRPGGRQLVSAGGGLTCTWDVDGDGRLLESSTVTDAPAVALTPDGSRLATASTDGTIASWHVASGDLLSEVPHPQPATTVAVRADGERLLAAFEDGTASIWDANSGTRIVLTHPGRVGRAVFDRSGSSIATVSRDRTVRIWDASTGCLRVELRHRETVLDAEFSPDGRHIVTVGAGTRVWPLPALDRVRAPRRLIEDDTEPTPRSWWLIGVGLLGIIGWLALFSDAPIGDRIWGVVGALLLAVGLGLVPFLRAQTTGSPRYLADVLELERLGEGDGFRATIAIELPDGTTLQLPLETDHKCPRDGATVVLWRGDRCLAPGEDPRTAEGAWLEHPLETYGWPACLVGLGACGLAVPFLPG